MADNIERIIANAIRESRNTALDTAIRLAEDFEQSGHSLHSYIVALRDMKNLLNPKETIQ